jgi:hypothetical protein
MAVEYDPSALLLREVWTALRLPIVPARSLLARQALHAILIGAQRGRPDDFEGFASEILYHAAGDYAFGTPATTELIDMLRPRSRSTHGAVCNAGVAEISEGSLMRDLAAFCLKLETIGFDIDSGPFCQIAEAGLGRISSPLCDRFAKRVVLIDRATGPFRHLRTLRTHRGFILQARLDSDLQPLRIDVFGPKYNAVGEWMDLVGAEGAWSLELRDAPGYHPEAGDRMPLRYREAR